MAAVNEFLASLFEVDVKGHYKVDDQLVRADRELWEIESATLGVYSEDGMLKTVTGIVGDLSDGLPTPSYTNGKQNVWLLDDPLDADDDYDILVDLTDLVNSKPEQEFDPEVSMKGLKGKGHLYASDAFEASPVESDDISPDILGREITIAGSMQGASDKFGWKNKTINVGQLISLLSDHKEGKKDGQSILQGSLVGRNRKATAVDKLDLLILDLDTGDTIDKIEARIREKGWFAVIYTTHSHMKPSTDIKMDTLHKFVDEEGVDITVDDAVRYLIEEKRYNKSVLEGATMPSKPVHKKDGIVYEVAHKPMPKFRLVFLLDRQFVIAERGTTQKEAIEEWKERYAGVAEVLRAAYDRSCVDPSRLMYTPRHPKGSKSFGVKVIDGMPLDIDTIPRVSQKGHKGPKNAFTDAGLDEDAELQNPWLRRFVAKYGSRFEAADLCSEFYDVRDEKGSKIITECPNDGAHSDAGNSDDQGFFCVNSSESDSSSFMMKCMHDSCSHLDRLGFLDLIVTDNDLELEDLKKFVLVTEDDEDVEDNEEEPTADGETTFDSYEAVFAFLEDTKGIKPTDVKKIVEWLKTVNPDTHNKTDESLLVSDVAKRARVAKKGILEDVSRDRMKRKEWKRAQEDEDDADIDEDHDINKKYRKVMERVNKDFALVKLGKTYCVVEIPNGDVSNIDGMNFNIFTTDAFRLKFSNETVQVVKNNEPKTMKVGDAWLEYSKRRDYDGGLAFHPDVEKVGHRRLNIWAGFPHQGVKGDWGLIHKHIFEVLCHENEEYYHYIMTFLAHCVQFPAEKPGSALVIRGKKGVGKSVIFEELMGHVLGKQLFMTTPRIEQVTGRFNHHLYTKIFLLLEEASWGGDKQSEGPLKTLITSKMMSYEAKGEAIFEDNNFTRVIMLANESWVVPVTEDERRYFVVEASDRYRGNTDYFKALYAQLESKKGMLAFLWELENWEADWSILRSPPKTKWLRSQQAMTRNRDDEFFLDFIDSGIIDENDRLDLDEIVFNEDTGTVVDKVELKKHFMQVCNGGEGRGYFKTEHFNQACEKYLGFNPSEGPRTRRRTPDNRYVDVLNIPSLIEIRERLVEANIL